MIIPSAPTIQHRRRLSLMIRLALLPLLLLLSGCSFIRVQNVTEGEVTVLVATPDGGNNTRILKSGGIEDWFSSHGGRYRVTLLANEDYLEILDRLKLQIIERLWEDRESLTAAEVSQLVENLSHIDRLLNDAAKPGAACAGHVPDFDTAIATVSYDSSSNEFTLDCGSAQ